MPSKSFYRMPSRPSTSGLDPDREIVISGKVVGAWAEVRISDNGPGVPAMLHEKLFREPIPRGQETGGMGIGALLAATIIQEHGGGIQLEQTGPNGTTVVFRFPIVKG